MGEIWFAGRELQIEEDAVLASPGFEWALQDDPCIVSDGQRR